VGMLALYEEDCGAIWRAGGKLECKLLYTVRNGSKDILKGLRDGKD
jgi:hypothetical protein